MSLDADISVYLSIVLGIIFFVNWRDDFNYNRRDLPLKQFLKSPVFIESIAFVALFLGCFWLVNSANILDKFCYGNAWMQKGAAVILSFGICLIWYKYLRWLDVFEQEKHQSAIIVFIMSCVTVWLVYPYTDLVGFLTGLGLNGEYLNDWQFCVFMIGVPEELVKIIPVLIFIRFTGEVDEPIDYIFYGSVSALGFAFVENTMYLENSDLNAVYSRALMASVSHMFNTSIICFGLAYERYRRPFFKKWTFPVYFTLAVLSHAFYDFWLLLDSSGTFFVITVLFFFGTIQVWVVMKNNLINISPYYDVNIKLNAGSFKYKIINMMLFLTLVTVVFKLMIYGQASAKHLFNEMFPLMLFTALYVSLNFSSLDIIRGYMRTIKLSPSILFRPLMSSNNLAGNPIAVKFPSNLRGWKWLKAFLKPDTPMHGTLERRVMYKFENDWYFVRLDEPAFIPGLERDLWMVQLKKGKFQLNDSEYRLASIVGFREKPTLIDGEVQKTGVKYLGMAYVLGNGKETEQ